MRVLFCLLELSDSFLLDILVSLSRSLATEPRRSRGESGQTKGGKRWGGQLLLTCDLIVKILAPRHEVGGATDNKFCQFVVKRPGVGGDVVSAAMIGDPRVFLIVAS